VITFPLKTIALCYLQIRIIEEFNSGIISYSLEMKIEVLLIEETQAEEQPRERVPH